MGARTDALITAVTRRAGWVLVLIAAITLGAIHQIVDLRTGVLRLVIDPAIDSMLPEDDEGRKFYDYVRKAFGSDETMVVAVSTDDVFTHDVLTRIQRIADGIAKLDGVHHVVAITNAANVRGSEDGIEVYVGLGSADPERVESRFGLESVAASALAPIDFDIEGDLTKRFPPIGRIHLVRLSIAESRARTRRIPKRRIKTGREFGGIGHDRQL